MRNINGVFDLTESSTYNNTSLLFTGSVHHTTFCYPSFLIFPLACHMYVYALMNREPWGCCCCEEDVEPQICIFMSYGKPIEIQYIEAGGRWWGDKTHCLLKWTDFNNTYTRATESQILLICFNTDSTPHRRSNWDDGQRRTNTKVYRQVVDTKALFWMK